MSHLDCCCLRGAFLHKHDRVDRGHDDTRETGDVATGVASHLTHTRQSPDSHVWHDSAVLSAYMSNTTRVYGRPYSTAKRESGPILVALMREVGSIQSLHSPGTVVFK